MEEVLYEIASMRLFAKLSLDQAIPEHTTIMNFRHLLELHQLARQLFDAINQLLSDASIMMKQRSLVDATIIEVPNSTKNKRGERAPEMHQTKKGNQWYFGMKAQVQHPRQGGTPVSDYQMPVWLCEGAVQGAPQERQPTGDVVYAGESVSSGPDDTEMG
jgi:hypothetical protein